MIPGWLLQAPDDRRQMRRLHAFRAAHPEVIIGDGGFGTWQARIPEPSGEYVITRHLLRELLDKLCEVFSPGRGGAPGGERSGDPDG